MYLEIVVPGLLALGMSDVPQQLARARMFVEARLSYDALAAYDAAIAASPDSADAHEGRGELLAQLPAFQELADAACEKADALRREGR